MQQEKEGRYDQGGYFIEGGLSGFEQIFECSEGVRYVDIWVKGVLSRGNYQCKGFEVGV